MRLVWLFLGLALLVLIPFFIWGSALETAFSQTGAVAWLNEYGGWAWLAGILLLMSDLVLPIPGTVIMSALGYLYGTIAGGPLSALGSFLAGALAYLLCRSFGTGIARRILGERDFERGHRIFEHLGGWIVALSRWLPVLPEVTACMAGLTRMPAGLFFLALACGSLPVGFAFALIGHTGVDHPLLAIGLSALVPALLWFIIRPFVFRRLRLD
jgi:uncharacterized membrane protein YdjX (TVP38/TMEM64 family)